MAAVIGSTFSQMPKTMIRTTPVTNSGTAASERPPVVMIRSTGLPTLSAAAMPPMRLSGTTITKARAASLREFSRAEVMNGRTGWR